MIRPFKTPDKDLDQATRLHQFRCIRLLHGDPTVREVLKKIAKTHTRHVTPEGWKWR